MRKGHSIIGLQVIAQSDGASLGHVTDLFFDHDADQCLGLVLRDKELFGLIAPQVVPWEAIQSIGKDAVVVTNKAVVVNPNDVGPLRAVWERETKLSGTRIFTEDGRDLGRFSEVYLDEKSGRVMGYEVSGGLVSDTMSGKRYVAADRTHELHVGADVLLADPSVAAEFSRQKSEEPGGLTAAYNSASEQVGDTYANIANASVEKQQEFVVGKTAGRNVYLPAPTNSGTKNGPVLVQEGNVITREHAQSATDAGILHALVVAAGSGAASQSYNAASVNASIQLEGTQQDALANTIGKPAAFDVDLPNGSTLVPAGMIITRDATEGARIHGVENKLIAAAGLGAASEKTQEVGEQISHTASHVWETVKEKTQELLGSAQHKKAELDEQAEHNAINHALGRPVTRVILAQNDEVILNTGDLITHKAVEHAKREGMLDVLLDSVYSAEPQITPEMMRLDEPGHDALEAQQDPDGKPLTVTVASSGPSQTMPGQHRPAQ